MPDPIVIPPLSVRPLLPAPVGEPHVVMSWPQDRDGRKRATASALVSTAGEPRAVARALWVELR